MCVCVCARASIHVGVRVAFYKSTYSTIVPVFFDPQDAEERGSME